MLPVTASEPVDGDDGNGSEGSIVSNLDELISVCASCLI